MAGPGFLFRRPLSRFIDFGRHSPTFAVRFRSGSGASGFASDLSTAKDYRQGKRRQPIIANEVIAAKSARPVLASTISEKCPVIRRITLPGKYFGGTCAAPKFPFDPSLQRKQCRDPVRVPAE